MKSLLYLYLICLATFMTGCSAIEGIFKAGVWVGVLVVVGIIGLILWLVMRSKK